MITGWTFEGATHATIAGDSYVGFALTLDEERQIVRVAVLADGAGGTQGTQRLRGVIRDGSGVLVAVGDETTVSDGESLLWRGLTFRDGARLPAGDYEFFLQASGPTGVAGLRKDTGVGTYLHGSDSYDSGPTTPVSPSSSTGRYSLFVEMLPILGIPDVEDLLLARLPWGMSQRALGTSGAISASRQIASAGWHGTSTDPETGANCVIRADGPLADLVGERLQITRRMGTLRRSIVVYAHTQQLFPAEVADEALSLPLAAMLRLAPLALDSVSVEVEVLA